MLVFHFSSSALNVNQNWFHCVLFNSAGVDCLCFVAYPMLMRGFLVVSFNKPKTLTRAHTATAFGLRVFEEPGFAPIALIWDYESIFYSVQWDWSILIPSFRFVFPPISQFIGVIIYCPGCYSFHLPLGVSSPVLAVISWSTCIFIIYPEFVLVDLYQKKHIQYSMYIHFICAVIEVFFAERDGKIYCTERSLDSLITLQYW